MNRQPAVVRSALAATVLLLTACGDRPGPSTPAEPSFAAVVTALSAAGLEWDGSTPPNGFTRSSF